MRPAERYESVSPAKSSRSPLPGLNSFCVSGKHSVPSHLRTRMPACVAAGMTQMRPGNVCHSVVRPIEYWCTHLRTARCVNIEVGTFLRRENSEWGSRGAARTCGCASSRRGRRASRTLAAPRGRRRSPRRRRPRRCRRGRSSCACCRAAARGSARRRPASRWRRGSGGTAPLNRRSCAAWRGPRRGTGPSATRAIGRGAPAMHSTTIGEASEELRGGLKGRVRRCCSWRFHSEAGSEQVPGGLHGGFDASARVHTWWSNISQPSES